MSYVSYKIWHIALFRTKLVNMDAVITNELAAYKSSAL